MRLRALRPVGEPLPAPHAGLSQYDLVPAGYRAVFTQSGTAALALALVIVAERAGSAGRRRVLLPAYGCPDLVAAVCCAGLEPELVDTAPDSPFMSQDALRARLGEDVLAVVGAHFLGLAEDIPALQALCTPHGVAVIEDSAQKVPGAGGVPAVAELVVMSFGRGKPAGALGGGALLLHEGVADPEAMRARLAPPPPGNMPPALRRAAYNLAIRPAAYGVLSRLPGLELGVTRYKPLDAIRALAPAGVRFALAGWAAAPRAPSALQAAWAERVDCLPGVRQLPAVGAQAERVPLARFVLLVDDAGRRAGLLARLQAEGLGASAMYGGALAGLDGMPATHGRGDDAARAFAARLLTLPLHSEVRDADLERLERLMRPG